MILMYLIPYNYPVFMGHRKYSIQVTTRLHYTSSKIPVKRFSLINVQLINFVCMHNVDDVKCPFLDLMHHCIILRSGLIPDNIRCIALYQLQCRSELFLIFVGHHTVLPVSSFPLLFLCYIVYVVKKQCVSAVCNWNRLLHFISSTPDMCHGFFNSVWDFIEISQFYLVFIIMY